MDDTTKLSPKLLSALLKLLKGQNADPALQPDALLETLTPEQQQTAKQMLADQQKLQTLLQNPQVRAFLRALQQQADRHGTGEL